MFSLLVRATCAYLMRDIYTRVLIDGSPHPFARVIGLLQCMYYAFALSFESNRRDVCRRVGERRACVRWWAFSGVNAVKKD